MSEKKEATQEGVPEIRRMSREDMLEDIASKAKDPSQVVATGDEGDPIDRGSEGQEDDGVADKGDEVGTPAAKPDDGDETNLENQGDDPATAGASTEEEEMVTIKVDGEERQVPRSKVMETGIRAMQKDTAADARLQAAAKRKKELEQLEARIREQMEALQGAAEKNYGKDLVGSIFDNEEQAEATINDLAAQLKGTQRLIADMATVNHIKAEDERETAAEANDRAEEELRGYFREHYSDIADDDDQLLVMIRQSEIIQGENPKLEPTEVVDKAAERVYAKFGGKKTPNTLPRQGRRAGSARQAPKPAPKLESTAEAIKAMQEARGQTPL